MGKALNVGTLCRLFEVSGSLYWDIAGKFGERYGTGSGSDLVFDNRYGTGSGSDLVDL
jgi:hypothetical protein